MSTCAVAPVHEPKQTTSFALGSRKGTFVTYISMICGAKSRLKVSPVEGDM